MSPSTTTRGLLATAGAALVFSIGMNLPKAINMAGLEVALWRLGIGAVTLTIAAVVLRSQWPRQWRYIVLGGLAFGLHQILYIYATKKTSIATVTLIGATMPLLVAVFAQWTVGEKATWRLLGWSGVAILGIGTVVGANLDDPSRSLDGDLLAVANIVFYTSYFLAAKRARLDGVGTLPLTAAIAWIGFGFVLCVAIPAGALSLPSGRDFALLIALAAGAGNGHLLVNWAHDKTSAAVASLVLLLVPLLAAGWAAVIHGEPLGVSHLIGFAIVAVAIEGGRRAATASQRRSQVRDP